MDHSNPILQPSLALKSSVIPSPETGSSIVFDTSLINNHPDNLLSHFLWPHEDLAYGAQDEFRDPPVDLKGFLNSDQGATNHAAAQIRAACLIHGFFQVVNHDVDPNLIQSVYKHMDDIFKLPTSSKMDIKRKPGKLSGYSGAHSDRFSSKLPWKETFSLTYNHAGNGPGQEVVEYVKSSLGQDFEEAGCAFQKYCEAMKTLALAIFELLGLSLGVDRLHYRNFFEDGSSILRGNNYPPCREASLTFGTGPHSDPSSLTILHQDQVGGLQIFLDNKWKAIRPRPDSFVVNIGDTFMALSNGMYKSCVHRAVVNKKRTRRSVVFFVNLREDKVVRPPDNQMERQYPDFTWSEFTEFTQNHYRADTDTLPSFVRWLNK